MKEFTKIIAIRHGETSWNVDARMQGQTDIALNENGIRQAELLAKALRNERLDAIYSSDLSRAYKTALALEQAKLLPVQQHVGLRERHFGSHQGFTFAQIEEKFPEEAIRWRQQDPNFIPGGVQSGGESLNAFSERTLEAMNEIARKHLNQAVAIVCHGGVLDVLYRAAKQFDMQAPRTWTLGNTSINYLTWSLTEGLTITSWGHVDHLDEEPLPVHGDPADLGPKAL